MRKTAFACLAAVLVGSLLGFPVRTGGQDTAARKPSTPERIRLGRWTWPTSEEQERQTMALTNTHWISTDGNWNAATSWSNGIPDGNLAVFDGSSQVSAIIGLDLSVVGTIPTHIITTEDFHGNIGGPGNALRSGAWGAGKISIIRGDGSCYLNSTGAYLGLVVDSANMIDAVTWYNDGSDIVAVKRGGVNITPDARLLSLAVVGEAAYVTLEADSAGDGTGYPTNLYVSGGILHAKRYTHATTTRHIHVSGGHVEHTGILGDGVKLVLSGGSFVYDPGADISGDTPNLFMAMDGTLDLSTLEESLTVGELFLGEFVNVITPKVATVQSKVPMVDLRTRYPK